MAAKFQADASIQSESVGPHAASELVLSVDFASTRNYESVERDRIPSTSHAPAQTAATTARTGDTEEHRIDKLPKCKYFQNGSILDHLIYFCALSVASYAGVLTRIYLANLQHWNGIPLFTSFYAEFVGTAIMGFIISHKKILQNHKAVYQAIATGLCGSITTFSSWNSEAVEVLLQFGRAPPDNAERIIGWVTVLIIGIGMPIAALLFGKHIAHLSLWSDCRLREDEEFLQPRKRYRIAVKVTIVLLWVCSTCLVIYLPYRYQKYDLMFSFVFCFVGTYIRWHLSPLNSLIRNFKLGTFIANILGAWILGSAVVVSSHFESELGQVEAAVVKGIGTGFCGCLTTVSTFTVELTTLPLAGSYVYGILSLALAQLGLVAIRGTYIWTR